MSAAAPDLLADLARSGIKLTPRGDKLHVEAPKGTLTPELRQTLAERKADLLREMARRSTPPKQTTTAQPGNDEAMLARCREACRGLSLWPAELLAALSEADRQAILSNDPDELKALRCFAESLSARLRTGELPPGIPEAYERLRRQLAEHPGLRVAVELLEEDATTGNRLLAVAICGRGCITLRVSPERMDEGRLLEIVARWNGEA